MRFFLAAQLLTAPLAQATPHSGVLDVSSGDTHSCALMADHRASCWGQGNPTPVPAGNVGDVAALATGHNFSCELRRTDKTVWCWGSNGSGQLGNNSTIESSSPVQVVKQLTMRFVPLANVIAIAAGYDHACALLADNTMWCWGQNAQGELGNHYAASVSPVATKVIVNDGSDAALNVATMAAGAGHTCAALSDGSSTAACWGYNKLGQLANDHAGDAANSPYPVLAPDGSHLGVFAPAIVTAGTFHTCVLVPDDDVNSIACFGDNESGELGNPYGLYTWTSTPAPVVYPDGQKLRNLAGLSAGDSFTCALLATDGSIACWGADNYGQLGHHGVADGYSVSPLAVESPAATLTGFLAISAGGEHACAVQVDENDPAPQPGIACWGHNDLGQLGWGTTDMSPHEFPAPVTGDWPLFTDNFGDD